MDHLASFAKQIGPPPTFTAEEERELCRKMRAGDRAAAWELYRSVFLLAVARTRDYRRSDALDRDAMLEIASDATWNAVRSFDPDEGRLATWTAVKVLDAIGTRRRASSLPTVTEGNEPYHSRVRTPASMCGAAEERTATVCQVRKAIEQACLTPREAEVLACREAGQTGEETAEQIGLTRRRVDQLHVSAAAKVRDCLGVETTVDFRGQYRRYSRKPRRPHDGPRKPRKALPAQVRLV